MTVDVTDDEQPAQISQSWCSVTRENRNAELIRALHAWGGALNLVFCNTKLDCAEVAIYLRSQNIVAIALHGDLDQRERNEVLVRFANRSATVLIATDVAARGLDVDDLDAVFNFELPKQAEVYLHRIGRTGRAGKQGVAISLVEQREEWPVAANRGVATGCVPKTLRNPGCEAFRRYATPDDDDDSYQWRPKEQVATRRHTGFTHR